MDFGQAIFNAIGIIVLLGVPLSLLFYLIASIIEISGGLKEFSQGCGCLLVIILVIAFFIWI